MRMHVCVRLRVRFEQSAQSFAQERHLAAMNYAKRIKACGPFTLKSQYTLSKPPKSDATSLSDAVVFPPCLRRL